MTVAAAALMGSVLTAGAQENYPTKTIRLIVPEVVGSAADLMSRIIGQRIGEALGQPVTFENIFLEAGVEKAMNGDTAAIREIADRIDGKVGPSPDRDGGNATVIVEIVRFDIEAS